MSSSTPTPTIDPGEKLPENVRRVFRGARGMLVWFLPPGVGSWMRRTRWGRVVGVGCGSLLVSYVALVAAVHALVRYRRGIETVRFVDLALPWRWGNYERARGNYFIATARREVKEGRVREALMLARAGIDRVPADRDGRLLLADLCIATRRLPYACSTLLEGLPYHRGDPAYLGPVLTFLLQRQEDAEVVALARRTLPELDCNSEAGRLLAIGAATASFFRGNYDQAEDFLRGTPGLATTRDGRLLAARIERDRGYPELARLKLEQQARELPHDAEIHRELVGVLRRCGLPDAARRSSLAFQIAHPQLAGPRLALVQAYDEAGENAQVEREVTSFLHDFPDDRAALEALAEFAANRGDRAMVARLARHAAERRLPPGPYQFLAIEAAIVARDYHGALDTMHESATGEPAFDRCQRAVFDSLQAIAYCGLKDIANTRLFLNRFLSQPGLRAENLMAVANRFAALNAPEHAWQTLAHAVREDSSNQVALSRLVELDLTLGRVEELARHVRQLVAMRHPSTDLLRVVEHTLGSDLFLFSPEAPGALALVHAAMEKARSQER